MAEYIDREALCKILENWRNAHADVDDEQGCGLLEDAIREVDAQPAADVVEVVRCRDCQKFKTYGCRMVASGYDDFCSYGERKDGDNAEG